MSDDPTPTPITVSVSLASANDERAATLAVPGCNDCTICRIIDAVRRSEGFPEGYEFPAAPFSEAPLDLNIVGLRKQDSHSNQFDDTIVAFYRPVDLDAGKVLDVEIVGEQVSVEAIESFLADSTQRNHLRLKSNPSTLPGIDSQSDQQKPCRTHLGWNLRVFSITTEPGFDKKVGKKGNKQYPAGSVALTANRDDGAIGNRRATLQPGVYRDSWRFYIHHWGKLTGYPALTQTAKIDIKRACRGDYLLSHVQRDAKGTDSVKSWRRQWLAVAKSARKTHSKAEKAHKKAVAEYEEWQSYLAARDEWEADGEVGDAPKKPKKERSERPEPPEPAIADPDESGWLADHLRQLLSNHLSLEQGMNKGRDKLLEIREEHLQGPKRPLADLRVDYELATVGEGKKQKQVLTIHSISADSGGGSWAALADQDIVVVQDNDTAGINIHRAGRSSSNVYNWSEGCQVFKRKADFSEFRALCCLSKRARCEKRRNGQCPSVEHGAIRADDLMFHYYADKRWKQRRKDLDRRFSTDAETFLREKLEGRAGDLEYQTMLEEKIEGLQIGSGKTKTPLHATWTYSRSTGWKDHKRRKEQLSKDIHTRFDEHLVPDTDNARTRKSWWDAMGRSIVKRVQVAVLHDVNTDSSLHSALESAAETIFQELQLTAETKKKSMSTRAVAARRRVAALRARKDPSVRSLWEAAEAASVATHLELLSIDLDTITDEVGFDIDAMVSRIRKRLAKQASRLSDAGLEICDLFKECDVRFSYVLGAPTDAELDAVLERFGKEK